ncbi:Transmembrane GTPase fzo1 [Hondaea fermentalgiana]|uniref:Transmembrane GTPase fzo1 n=1 Tax=Hondaea fermentalgiana TaxID=2315210 RepID=A0A2R5GH60_9STRA|nr:Transmembrane GTPase fzo1 [Hondaea fermentalgiana]|eukprot:GBG30246.1 Transmembrane GTPase fzo1 [Hondaea fermentalgiana]
MSEETDLRVTVLGSINAGKSTLLNALIGAELLPSAATIETACIAEVRHDASLEPGTFKCSSVVEEGEEPKEDIFGENEDERRDSHTRVLQWIRHKNQAEGMPRLTIRTNLTTAKHYTSLGLGGISFFDVPGTNETNGYEDRVREVGKVLARAHFVCIVVSKDEIGATSIEELGALVRKYTKPSCQVGLFINKMDDVVLKERDGIKKSAETEKYNEEKRKALFGRPITFYYTMGKAALHSACRGCDLLKCELVNTHIKLACELPEENNMDGESPLSRNSAARKEYAKVKDQQGIVGPFVARNIDVSDAEQKAREMHDKIARETKKLSGINTIWEKLVLDMLKSRIQMVRALLDVSSESVLLHPDYVNLENLAKYAPEAVEVLARLLSLQRSYDELESSLHSAAESYASDVGRHHEDMNVFIMKKVPEVVTTVPEAKSWNEAPTETVRELVSSAIKKLAEVVRGLRRNALRKEVNAGTREGLKASLENFIGDTEALQSHVPEDDNQYLKDSIKQAVRPPERNFAQLSLHFERNDWTEDRTNVARAFQQDLSGCLPESLEDAPVWFPDLKEAFQEAASLDLDRPNFAQELAELSGSTIKATFDAEDALKYFVLEIYPVITEAAEWYKTVMQTLDKLGLKSDDLDTLRVDFGDDWITQRNFWVMSTDDRKNFLASEGIKTSLERIVQQSAEKHLSSKKRKSALKGAMVGAAVVGAFMTGGGLAMGAAVYTYGAAASSIVASGSGAGAVTGWLKGSTQAGEITAFEECKKKFAPLVNIFLASHEILTMKEVTAKAVENYLSRVRSNARSIYFRPPSEVKAASSRQ